MTNFNAELSRLFYDAKAIEKNMHNFQRRAWRLYLALQSENRRAAKIRASFGAKKKK